MGTNVGAGMEFIGIMVAVAIGLTIQWWIIKTAVQAGVKGAALAHAREIDGHRKRFHQELIPGIQNARKPKAKDKAHDRALAALAHVRDTYGTLEESTWDEIESEIQQARMGI